MRAFGMIFLVLLAAGGFVGLQSVYTVNEREQALILRLGEPVDAVNEVGDDNPGLHFKAPFIMEVLYFEKRNIEDVTNYDPSRIDRELFGELLQKHGGALLGRMRELDFITEENYLLAVASPVTARLHGLSVEVEAPYVAEMVRQWH